MSGFVYLCTSGLSCTMQPPLVSVPEIAWATIQRSSVQWKGKEGLVDNDAYKELIMSL